MAQLAPALPIRIAKAVLLLMSLAMLSAFETPQRVDARIIKPLPRTFRLAAVAGDITPTEARFRRSGNTYVNEAPSTSGATWLDASWFAVHPTDSDAILIEYPATDGDGDTIYRLEYALEEDRNRYRLYTLDETRFITALDALESAVRRNDAGGRDRRFYQELTAIWNAHVSRAAETPGGRFHVSSIEDINILIAYSRRLDEGSKILVSTGDMVEVYVR